MKIREKKNLIASSIFWGLLSGLCLSENIDINRQLIQARKDLVLARETQGRIRMELQQLSREEEAPDEVLRDYTFYLDRVQKMVALHRRRVQRIEGKAAQTDSKGNATRDSNIEPAIKHTPLPTHSLADEFAQSLSAFDEFVLQELEILNKKKTMLSEEEELAGLAADAADAVQRLARKGIDISASQNRPEQQEGGSDDSSVANILRPSDSENPGAGEMLLSGPSKLRSASEGFMSDDDIVARQLLEAAEKEKDPELKEKLFKEYHAYKQTLQRRQIPANGSEGEKPDNN